MHVTAKEKESSNGLVSPINPTKYSVCLTALKEDLINICIADSAIKLLSPVKTVDDNRYV